MDRKLNTKKQYPVKMTFIEYEIKPFSGLTTRELYDLLKLRVDVFVVEQKCPYPELDDKDTHPETLHLTGKTSDRKIISYLRIMPPKLHFKEAAIGRVVVTRNHRGAGICNAMVQKAIDRIHSTWPGQDIRIGAQVYLVTFYQSIGFETISDMYLEDGIPHIDMIRRYPV